MRTRNVQLMIAAGFALAWLVPALTWAQVATIATASNANVVVEQLQYQAESLYPVPARWADAGALLEKAARLLAVEDPASVPLLRQAGRLQAYSGQFARAAATMQEAGWRSLGQGDVVAAAHAYADGACIAVDGKDLVTAKKLVDVVSLLSRWPGVTPSQRREILSRI